MARDDTRKVSAVNAGRVRPRRAHGRAHRYAKHFDARTVLEANATAMGPSYERALETAEFVACSIAVGSKTMDSQLLSSLPALLEPFAPLSPVLEAIWQNAIATREAKCECRYESAWARWIDVLAKLDATTGAELQHVEPIGSAVAFAIGMLETTFGLASATRWATRLDHDRSKD